MEVSQQAEVCRLNSALYAQMRERQAHRLYCLHQGGPERGPGRQNQEEDSLRCRHREILLSKDMRAENSRNLEDKGRPLPWRSFCTQCSGPYSLLG